MYGFFEALRRLRSRRHAQLDLLDQPGHARTQHDVECSWRPNVTQSQTRIVSTHILVLLLLCFRVFCRGDSESELASIMQGSGVREANHDRPPVVQRQRQVVRQSAMWRTCAAEDAAADARAAPIAALPLCMDAKRMRIIYACRNGGFDIYRWRLYRRVMSSTGSDDKSTMSGLNPELKLTSLKSVGTCDHTIQSQRDTQEKRHRQLNQGLIYRRSTWRSRGCIVCGASRRCVCACPL